MIMHRAILRTLSAWFRALRRVRGRQRHPSQKTFDLTILLVARNGQVKTRIEEWVYA
jgi:hypothetical protein